jgi:hypothetical protein
MPWDVRTARHPSIKSFPALAIILFDQRLNGLHHHGGIERAMDGEPGSHLPALFPEESVSIRDILVDLGSDGLDGDGIGGSRRRTS